MDKAELAQQHQRLDGSSAAQQPEDLFQDARHRAFLQLAAVVVDGAIGLVFDIQAEPRRKLHRAQHPHRVFAEANAGVADGPHAALRQVGKAADVVDDLSRRDVVKQAVDRKVATAGVFFGGAKDVVALDQQVAVFRDAFFLARVGAKSRRLDDLASEDDVSQAEAATDDAAVAKEVAHL